ncbi:MAG: hypothetical protein JO154_04955 [Chitinophaga sp.]|uniref:hypothetical protein n=1 Tax=Chitinophaga sp. TaxID=1869181 RepID=UPI0025B89000|nr:hypothetical protein [Chitinophaga sp.]MBV8251938.1 hypothetical protein [Chitinophaga sp.]
MNRSIQRIVVALGIPAIDWLPVMKNIFAKNLLRSCCVAILLPLASHAQQWVSLDAKGKLQYDYSSRGDRILDFSYAGYKGGGVSIPNIPATITLQPVPGDNAAGIQAAIDKVSALPLKNGFRGMVLLSPGNYECQQTIQIQASGVVLAGSGSGENGTILQLSGAPHMGVVIKGKPVYSKSGARETVTDTYVPAGAMQLQVGNGKSFKLGDTVRITKPVTPQWVKFMGMDDLVRDGKPQTWINGELTTDRIITTIKGNTLQFDVPLTDNYDAAYTSPEGTVVEKISTTGELTNCGIMNFRMVSPSQTGTINDRHHQAFFIGGITDAWASNIQIFNTINSITITGRRITLDSISIFHDDVTIGAAKPADISTNGPQQLVKNCYIKGANVFYIATGAKVTGPIVIMDCVFEGGGWIQPHQRWATGLLVDNCKVPGGGIDFMNRGEMGSGHGWAIGWAVAWNSSATSFLNQQPPGAMNWMIGCSGAQRQEARPFDKSPLLPSGIYVSQDHPVQPQSLYKQQLQERLGKR